MWSYPLRQKRLLVNFSSSLYQPKKSKKKSMDLVCVPLCRSANAPLGASVDSRCVLDSCPLRPRWRRLWRFQDRNLQGHHTWLCCCCWTFPLLLSPFAVTHSPPKSSCGYLRRRGATEEMRSARNQRPPKVLVLTQKTSDRQAARPERSSCQPAAELHVAVLLDLAVC